MSTWILIILFHAGYSGGMASMTSTSVRFYSKEACLEATKEVLRATNIRNKESNGLVSSMSFCVEDKK